MKYCVHCGAELLDEAVICPKCYSDVAEINTGKKSEVTWCGLAIGGFIVSFFSGIAGLIMSIVGLTRIRSNGLNGKNLAIAGIVISGVHLAITLVDCICWIILFTRYW